MSTFFLHSYITPNIIRIAGVLTEYMYLIIGENRAILIDTGCGAGNIREYVSSITDLPVTVVITHGHFDHMGGAYWFDEVWISEKEAIPTPIHYEPGWVAAQLQEQGIDVQEQDMTPLRELRYHWLHDGMTFSVGETEIECILVPGHTVETYAVLFRKERLLLTGDACHNITYLFFDNSLPAALYEQELKKLKTREAEWDELLLSHPMGRAPKEMLDTVIEVCEDIVHHRIADIPFSFRGIDAYIAKEVTEQMNRKDGKIGNIIYRKE